MDFTVSEGESLWCGRVRNFIAAHIRPREREYEAQQAGERWKVLPAVEEEKARAKREGLWNLFMPPRASHEAVDETFEFEGPGLSNLEYALCAEEMGRIEWASEVFNCSAPDTGNMEVPHRYGTRVQKEQWLAPLMRGEIRSAFLMTEPAVASSDATNIETRIEREGNHYKINGRKWWSSGAGDPRCKIAIVMIKVAAPRIALRIIDDAIQAHGGAGVSPDFGLAKAYAHIRSLRLADGPDEVHNRAIARLEFAKHQGH